MTFLANPFGLFWDQLTVNRQTGELLCQGCGFDLYSLTRSETEYRNFCSVHCYRHALKENGYWLYEELDFIISNGFPSLPRAGSTSPRNSSTDHHPARKNRRKLWKQLHTFLITAVHTSEEQQILLSSINLLGYFLSRLFSSLPDQDFTLLQHWEEYYQTFQRTFPVPASSHRTVSYTDVIIESHGMLVAILQYGDYEIELSQLFPNAATDKPSDLISQLCHSIVTVQLWYEINAVINQYGFITYRESSFLKRIQTIPSLSSFERRKLALSQYQSYLPRALEYFHSRIQSLICENQNEGHDDNQSQDLSTIEEERRIIRLAQAAELANKPNHLFATNHSTHDTPTKIRLNPNPFDNFGSMVLVLSPDYIPRDLYSPTATITNTYTHACQGNMLPELGPDPEKPLSLQCVKTRKIREGKVLTINILKDHTVYDHDISKGARSYYLGESLSYLKRTSSTSHPQIEKEEDSPISYGRSKITCQCILCQYYGHEQSNQLLAFFTTHLPGSIITKLVQEGTTTTADEDTPLFKRTKYEQVLRLRNKEDYGYYLRLLIKEWHGLNATISPASLQTMITQERSTLREKVSPSQCQSYDELLLIANHAMMQEKVLIGMFLYLLPVLHLLSLCSTTTNTTTVDPARITTEEECDFQIVGELFLSLGMSIFESFSLFYHPQLPEEQNKTIKVVLNDWQFEDLVLCFQYGRVLDSLQRQVFDAWIEKLEAYRGFWRSNREANTSSLISSRELLPQQLYLTTRSLDTTTQLLTLEECNRIILATEAFTNLHGWTTSRHYTVPTTDIPLLAIPEIASWFIPTVLIERIRPLLQQQFYSTIPSERVEMLINDLFIVKYQTTSSKDQSAETVAQQRYLPIHADQSTHSFVIALNQGGVDYQGGGTYFLDLYDCQNCLSSRNVINPGTGEMVSFCGHLYHGGDPVLEGTRYIMAGFLLMRPLLKGATRIEQTKGRPQLKPLPFAESLNQASQHFFSFQF